MHVSLLCDTSLVTQAHSTPTNHTQAMLRLPASTGHTGAGLSADHHPALTQINNLLSSQQIPPLQTTQRHTHTHNCCVGTALQPPLWLPPPPLLLLLVPLQLTPVYCCSCRLTCDSRTSSTHQRWCRCLQVAPARHPRRPQTSQKLLLWCWSLSELLPASPQPHQRQHRRHAEHVVGMCAVNGRAGANRAVNARGKGSLLATRQAADCGGHLLMCRCRRNIMRARKT